MNATTSQLARAIEAMSVPGILVDHRLIADGEFKVTWERDNMVEAQRVKRGPRVDPQSFGSTP